MQDNESKKAPETDESDVLDLGGRDNDDDKVKGGSVIDAIRAENTRKRRAALDAQSKAAAEAADKDRAKREEYARKLAQDRVELMKLKAGVIGDEDIPHEKEPQKVYTKRERFSNFMYHNKGYILFGLFVTALAAFFIYDIASKVEPDVSVMFIATDEDAEFYTENIEDVLEKYCADYNGDGHIYVRVSYLPAIVDTSEGSAGLYYAQSYQTKLVAEFQSADSIMVITDDETNEALDIAEDGVLADMTKIYPDDENATEIGYKLSATKLAEDSGIKLADDLYLGLRAPTEGLMVNTKKFQTNYDNALELWNNYLNGKIINESTTE